MTPSVVSDQAPTRTSSAAWYMLLLLFLVYMLSAVDRMVVALIVEPLKQAFHATDAQIGFLSGFAYSVPFALASLPMGLLVDRLTRTRLLPAILAIWSVTTAICALAPTYLTLVLARMAVGASEAGAIPASLSLLSDTFPPARRGVAIGLFYGAANVAQLLLFIGGAWLLLHFGWHSVFLIAGVPGLALALAILLTAREPARGGFDLEKPAAAVARPKMLQTLIYALADGPIRYAILGNMVATGVVGALTFWVISFFVRVHGVSQSVAASIVGVCLGVLGSLGAVVAGALVDRFARGDVRKMAAFAAVAGAAAAITGICMVITPTLYLAVGAYGLLCFIKGAFIGPGNLLVLSVSPSPVRGSVTALNKLTSILLGSGLFSWLAGQVSDMVGGQMGIRTGLLVVVSCFLLSSVFFHLTGASITRSKRKAAPQAAG